MATINSNGTGGGNWSATTTWAGGVVPVEGDKVTIVAGDTVVVEGTYTAGDDSSGGLGSAAIDVYGQLKASRTVSSSLTIKGKIAFASNVWSCDYGTESDPIPDGITAEFVINKADTPAIRDAFAQAHSNASDYIYFTMCGSRTRTRGVPLQSIASATDTIIYLSTASHGWKVGDNLVLWGTDDNASNQTETRYITAISGNEITLDSALTYNHKALTPICNLTSNVVIRSYNEVSGQTGGVSLNWANGSSNYVQYFINDVEFRNTGDGNAMYNMSIRYNQNSTISGYFFDNCTFMRNAGSVESLARYQAPAQGYWNNCVVKITEDKYFTYTFNASTTVVKNCYLNTRSNGSTNSYWENTFFCVNTSNPPFTGDGIYRDCTIAGRHHQISSANKVEFYNCDLWSTFGGLFQYGGSSQRVTDRGAIAVEQFKFDNCKFHPSITVYNPQNGTDLHELDFINKNQDNESQEYYSGKRIVKRENVLTNRSTSSIQIKNNRLDRIAEHEILVPASNNETVTILCYVQMDTDYYNLGDCNYPTLTLSGLGITPVVETATVASNGAWELIEISATNNVVGYDGNLTLTLTVDAKSTTAGYVYFDGIPDGRYITKTRHYGYVFNETAIKRTVNALVSADEATATAYTGVTINASTAEISFSAGTADTAQKFYDYSQAWAVNNLDEIVPFTRAGSLYSLDDSYTVIDPIFTGLVTWNGGSVRYTTTGTKLDTISGSTIEFSAIGSYNLSSADLEQVVLSNVSGGSITVDVLAGTNYTTLGTNITVNEVTQQNNLTFTVYNSDGNLHTGYEWRLYESDPAIGIIGLIELDGEEVATQSSQTYLYNYTSDTPVVVQIIDQPTHREALVELTLSNLNQSISINLEKQENI